MFRIEACNLTLLCRDIAGIMALYRQPLDFIIVAASALSPPTSNVLPALLLLLKSRGASLIVTGIERGLEDEVGFKVQLPVDP